MCNSLWGQIYSSELKGRLLTLHYITSLRAPVGPLFSSPNTPVLNLISSVSEFSPCLMLFEGFSSVTVKVIIQTEALSTCFGNSQQLRCGCFGRSLIKTWKSNSLEFQNNSSSAAISCYLGKIWTENETRQLLKKTLCVYEDSGSTEWYYVGLDFCLLDRVQTREGWRFCVCGIGFLWL